MKNILLNLIIILYISFAECIENQNQNYKALFFDRIKKTLIQVPNKIPQGVKYDQWVSACPAENNVKEEIEFNEKKSFSQNALFVREIYNEENLTNLSTIRCDKPFKLSIAIFNKMPLYYEFGYDIYVNRPDSKKFTISDRGKYRSLNAALKISTKLKYLQRRLFNIPIGKEEDKRFLWIPLFKVRSDDRHLQRIVYEIRKNNTKPTMECEDYSLGKEMINSTDVDNFYSEKSQAQIIKQVNIPDRDEAKCISEYQCFEKWLLIPADQFQFGYSAPLSCSNMATIPIWSSIVKGILSKLDKFLYALSQVSGHPLRIVAGVHETLELTTSRMELKKYILLKSELLNLRVPKIIYKSVKLKVNEKCKIEDPDCWHGILIVIHNDPSFENKNAICTDESEELGWEEIMYKTLSTSKKVKPQYIYVCSINKETLNDVGLQYNGKPITKLSLKKFPYYKNGQLVEEKDIRTEVTNELNRTSVSENKSEFNSDEVIERPFIDNEKHDGDEFRDANEKADNNDLILKSIPNENIDWKDTVDGYTDAGVIAEIDK